MVKIAAIGDNVVDCYVSSGLMYPGGNTLNVSVFARRFGAETAYVGAVGNDAAGRHLVAALSREGVDLSRLRVENGPTAYCIIGHNNGDRVFLRFDLGVSMFNPSREDFEYLGGYDAVHVGRSSGLDAHLPEIAHRTKLSYDFATQRDANHIATIAPHCFLAVCSGGELGDAEVEALLQQILNAGSQWALVTRGSQGAVLSDGRNTYAVPANPVSVVDTLGAGDTFTARTLFGLLKREQPDDLLRASAAAAAETCLYAGAVGYGVPVDIDVPVAEMTRRSELAE